MNPLTSPFLDLPGIRHAFFTRQGGVSTGIYDSLNVGRGSEDEPADVAENRRRAAAHFGLPVSALSTCYQIHSATALVTDRPWGDERPEGDAVVTATRGVLCGALAADCAPILIADAEGRVVASAHAGWKGALNGVAEAAVAAMSGLGADPSRMVAVVGPCIGQASYEVGLEFLAAFTAKAPDHERFFAAGEGPEKRMFDLPGFVVSRLKAAGVATADWIGHDTCAEEDLFFSNRRAFKRGEPDFGRLLSAISLV
ncbi:peptidoglycan editing factor PgeF [Phenylobacterium sp.]|uniref:peptidoglycan editing factor PgeF n=1 Tax=Phenylobacterium sp. TaxID=1871053 RepID=UPI002727ACE9|nr:peptidoglycan editing factor PgeF [Phenylobacterium sp.]MDO8800958.1 peptidoglycan editing factor PgeF [Phenylobacterium sp.]